MITKAIMFILLFDLTGLMFFEDILLVRICGFFLFVGTWFLLSFYIVDLAEEYNKENINLRKKTAKEYDKHKEVSKCQTKKLKRKKNK